MPARTNRKSERERDVPKKENGKVAKAKKSTTSSDDAKLNAEKVLYRHWLMKSEPESRFENGVDMKFGIEDLKKSPNQTEHWDGVRNYQARNFMKNMKVGDEAFFYHSNCKVPGIAGLMTIEKEAYEDHTQFIKGNAHYDPTSKREDPRWCMVDVKFQRDLKRYVTLPELKALHLEHKKSGGVLANLSLFTRTRLSVQPLTKEEFEFILTLENQN